MKRSLLDPESSMTIILLLESPFRGCWFTLEDLLSIAGSMMAIGVLTSLALLSCLSRVPFLQSLTMNMSLEHLSNHGVVHFVHEISLLQDCIDFLLS